VEAIQERLNDVEDIVLQLNDCSTQPSATATIPTMVTKDVADLKEKINAVEK